MLGVERRSLGLMLGVLAGCFAEPSPADRQCTPGTQISCDCFKGDGVQVCRLSGDGFEPCQCGSGATEGPATGDATSVGGSTDSTSSQGSDDDVTASTGGTMTDPGTTNGTTESDVVINELVHDPLAGDEDWIELYNRGEATVDVSSWVISDGGNYFTIPRDTMLEPGAYLVYTRNEPGSFTWGFGDDELVLLYDARGEPVDSADWQLGEATEPDSFGRLPNGSGPFQELTPTKGAANE